MTGSGVKLYNSHPDVVGRVSNDVDVNALEEELAALMLQDNGKPLPPRVHSTGRNSS